MHARAAIFARTRLVPRFRPGKSVPLQVGKQREEPKRELWVKRGGSPSRSCPKCSCNKHKGQGVKDC